MNKSNSRSDQNLLGAQPDVVRQTVDDSLLGRPHVAEKAFSTEATKVMPKGEKTPDERFADLQDMTRGYLTDEEEAKLETAPSASPPTPTRAQCRKSGEPFIAHPVEVAIILADLRMDVETHVRGASARHGGGHRRDQPAGRAGCSARTCAQLVDGVTKITRIEVETLTDEQAATIRKMFVAMSKDIRVIVIKLADRLHNMRTLAALAGGPSHLQGARDAGDLRAHRAPPGHQLASSGSWRTCRFFYLEPNKYKQVVAHGHRIARSSARSTLTQVISVLSGEMEQGEHPGRRSWAAPSTCTASTRRWRRRARASPRSTT